MATMAIHFAASLLIVTTITAAAQQTSPAATPLPPPPLSTTNTQTPPPDIHENQLKNALIGAGDYGRSANLLSSVNSSGKSFDPFLQKLAVNSRIPTLLPSKSVVITNNSASNFTIDASKITQADIFSISAFPVHGISKILDYSVYSVHGDVISAPEKSPGEIPDAADDFEGGLWGAVFVQIVKILLYTVIFNFLSRLIGD